MDTLTKLGILADAAKYDAACTSSGMDRAPQAGKIGSTTAAGLCHSFTPDGRCVTLLKVLLSNACSYDCAYCVNRRQASVPRATFTPRELAELTVDFYKRNYIEGLFLSSGVLGTPDATTERMIACLRILRHELRFNGYVHAKVIPGTSTELVDALGRLADRLSVNLELPSSQSLVSLCPDKDAHDILQPMAYIRRGRDNEEQQVLDARKAARKKSLRSPSSVPVVPLTTGVAGAPLATTDTLPGILDDGQPTTGLSSPPGGTGAHVTGIGKGARLPRQDAPYRLHSNSNQLSLRKRSAVSSAHRGFTPAGQSTQLIIGATPENDNHILQLSYALYERYDLKRVFFSAYMPMVADERLPERGVPVPLRREHRLYQADWLMRYYAFSPDELATPEAPWLDLEVDPKLAWALAHLDRFPVEVMDAPLELLLRVPGVGPVGARRIIAARKGGPLGFDDLERLHITLKRARHFLSCSGKRDVRCPLDAELIRERVINDAHQSSYNRARRQAEGQLALF